MPTIFFQEEYYVQEIILSDFPHSGTGDGRPLLGFVEIEGPFPPPSEPQSTWKLRLPAGRYRLRAHARRCESSWTEVDLTKPQAVSIRLAPRR